MTVRILLADDHAIVRDGLRAMIEKQPEMTVVAEAENGREAIQLASEHKPDVAIIDVGMPVMNGIDAAQQIIRKLPGTRIIALSMHSDRRMVAGMLKAGASGYVLKDCAFDELAQAVQTVVSGGTYLSPTVAGSVVEEYVRRLGTSGDPVDPVLTPRERQVLQLLAEGHSTKDIAASLSVSPKTIETHRLQIMNKLGFHSIAELTKYAIREGLTSLDD